jgi:hypothetical protein
LKAVLTKNQLSELGPEVLPFERTKFTRFVEAGEDILFDKFIHNMTISGVPINIVRAQVEAIEQNMAPLQKYLWIIDQHGLKIIGCLTVFVECAILCNLEYG